MEREREVERKNKRIGAIKRVEREGEWGERGRGKKGEPRFHTHTHALKERREGGKKGTEAHEFSCDITLTPIVTFIMSSKFLDSIVTIITIFLNE